MFTPTVYTSYKYNERSIVWNEKHLVRLYDIAFDGYNGGKCTRFVDAENMEEFRHKTFELNQPYDGPSMIVLAIKHDNIITQSTNFPSPILLGRSEDNGTLPVDPEHCRRVQTKDFDVWKATPYKEAWEEANKTLELAGIHNRKTAGAACQENETCCSFGLAFQGSMRTYNDTALVDEVSGNGHHGPDYVGVASVRSGKGLNPIPTSVTNSRLV